MNRLIPLVLIVLLIGTAGYAVWQAQENRQLQAQNNELKRQLDAQAAQLRQTEEEKQRLEAQLNDTQTKLVELQVRTSQLEQQVKNQTAEIERLREQLKIKDYTTIGLTFLWNKAAQFNTGGGASPESPDTALSNAVLMMNQEWDSLHIYFFIYHSGKADYLPISQRCSNINPSWAAQAWSMYPGNDIPIAIFSGINLLDSTYGGCAWVDAHVIAMTDEAIINSDFGFSLFLTHELCHIFHVSDEDMGPLAHQPIGIIPSAWYGRLESAAKQYQMPIPSEPN